MNAPANNRGDGGGRDGIGQGELFDPPPFSPIYPNPENLTGRALSMLLTGAEIEHPDFERATGSWRLAAYINDLIKMGWPVHALDVSDRPGRVIARYTMPERILKELRVRHGH